MSQTWNNKLSFTRKICQDSKSSVNKGRVTFKYAAYLANIQTIVAKVYGGYGDQTGIVEWVRLWEVFSAYGRIFNFLLQAVMYIEGFSVVELPYKICMESFLEPGKTDSKVGRSQSIIAAQVRSDGILQ